MPSKPMRPCQHPGCRTLTRETYCEIHRPKPTRSQQAERWHRWYSLPIWQQLRRNQLLREPFCRECADAGRRTRATDVDHIRAHRGRWPIFTDPANLQSLCHSCHARKTAEEMRKRGAK